MFLPYLTILLPQAYLVSTISHYLSHTHADKPIALPLSLVIALPSFHPAQPSLPFAQPLLPFAQTESSFRWVHGFLWVKFWF